LNKRSELERLRKIETNMQEAGLTTLHLRDGSKVVINDMVWFGSEAMCGGEAMRLFKQTESFDEPGGSRLGELLSMIVGNWQECK
jgi:hypothetical protein